MLKIKSITVEGFRSFRSSQRLVIRNGARLTQLQGSNQVEPELGANGAGKSSIWEALCWCFYGVTSRGQRGPSVMNRETSDVCSVKVALVVRHAIYVLRRTQSPNSLVLITEDDVVSAVSQDEVDELLGVGVDAFQSACYHGQFSETFFDMGPTKKLDMISSVFKLELWFEAAERARSDAKQCSDDRVLVERRLASFRGELRQVREELTQAEQAEAGWADEQAGELLALAPRLASAEAQLTASKRDRGVSRKAYASRLADFEDAERKLARIDTKRERSRDKLSTRSRKLAVLMANQGTVSERILELEELGTECPTCAQEIDSETLCGHLEELKAKHEELAEESEAARQRLSVITKERDNQESKLTKAIDRLDVCERLRDQTNQQLVKQRRVCQSDQQAYDKLTADFEKLEAGTNPHADRHARLSKSAGILKKKIRARVAQVADLESTKGVADFWTKRFKEIRLWIIDQALEELTVFVNNNLQALGMLEWSIGFEVERVTKAGKVSKGFQVLVKSPDNDEPVPWESWSGGEEQRLRIAGAAGFSDLIDSRLRVHPNCEIWDEPTAHLSVEGTEDLLAFLRERSRLLGRNIWVIDHRTLNGAFDAVYRVVKTAGGSRIFSSKKGALMPGIKKPLRKRPKTV